MQWQWEELEGCPVCGHGKSLPHYDRQLRSLRLRFDRCASCSLVYQSPRLTRQGSHCYFNSEIFIEDGKSDDFDLENLWGYPDYLDWDKSYESTSAIRLKRIARFSPPPGKLLEIGTATGAFLKAAQGVGYQVEGIDISDVFAAMAKRRYGFEIRREFIEEAELSPDFYDVICVFGGISCWRDPLRAMKNVWRALKPNGLFVFNAPDLEAFLPRLMSHRYFEFNPASFTIFSRRSLRECLLRAGFQSTYSQSERQIASLGRIFTYLKCQSLVSLTRKLRVASLEIPVIVPGTVLEICRKEPPRA